MHSKGLTVRGRRVKETRKREAAFLLSLVIPGLGQFIRGRIVLGIALVILDAAFIAFLLFIKPLMHDLELDRIFWTLWTLSFVIYYLVVAFDSYKGPQQEAAPCGEKCPAGINVPDYVALVANGRYDEADELIRERAPFAGVLGRICPAPCEEVCTRTRIEEPVAIRALKRSAAYNSGGGTYDLSNVRFPKFKVAVVGAGPSGLSAAHFIARRGYKVDIFDREPSPGGILRDIIPCFRLPGEVVRSDIDYIMKSNPALVFHPGKSLGADLSLAELERSYDAVYLALGASRPRPLLIEGESLEGVIGGLDFLRSACVGAQPALKGHVAVLGGGNTAVDSARTALRLGARKVTLFYRRMRSNMPAYVAEIEEAEREGVRLEFLAAPLRFRGRERVSRIRFARMRLTDHRAGRVSMLEAVEGEEWEERVDAVIVAVGQEPDLELLSSLGLPVDIDGKIKVNSRTLRIRKKLFAGGDAVRGPRTVVEAVADGLKAAMEIDYFLRPVPLRRLFEKLRYFSPDLGVENLPDAAWRMRRPPVMERVPEVTDYMQPALHKETMCGIAKGLDLQEARRCLRCHRYNPGFTYKTGKQKGYLSADER